MSEMYYAGIMTGTSLDSVNAVLCRTDDFSLVAHATMDIPQTLADEFRALDDEGALGKAMDAATALTRLCGDTFLSLPAAQIENVVAIGCHGQTVLHRPQRGWTLQLLNGALLAEITNTNIICDFRMRDIAAGGQGAPLAPLFHRHFFAAHAPCAVVNLGGIANITVLQEDGQTRGWDIAPANMLMDAWYRRHCQGRFDDGGAWAASGSIDKALLQKLQAHPFLKLPPPKSCGREEFDLRHFESDLNALPPQNGQATLLEWSASAIAAVINNENVQSVFLCGGGARNSTLFSRLQTLCNTKPQLSDSVGIDAEHVEAAAFAWLAKQFMNTTAVDTSAITGARGARILGALYPASEKNITNKIFNTV